MSAPVTGAQGQVSVATARERAASLLTRRCRDWAVDSAAASAATLSVALHPPTQARALEDQVAARAWVRTWQGVDGVLWEERRWANLGTQLVPARLRLEGAEAIGAFAGARSLARFTAARALVRRAEAELLPGGDELPADEEKRNAFRAVLRTHLGRLQEAEEAEVERVLEFTRWLSTEDVSGYLLRQVPLRGVDTKWLAGHRAVIEALVSVVRGGSGLGLRAPAERVRIRFLDASLAPAGLTDVEAPVAQLDALQVAATAVLVVENLQTFLALPALQGTVAVFGAGYGAGSRLSRLGWMHAVRVLYWGDLDSHGFAVLHQFRSAFPRASSLLMDADTLLAHRDLWVTEPSPARGAMPSLTQGEAWALKLLRSEGDVRLEQERIPWAVVVSALEAAVG